MVGILNGFPSKPMLVSTQFLEIVNSSTINQAFNKACQLIWPEGIKYDNVLLVVSDQATTMVKAISDAKVLYPNMKHVTCLDHALHRVCETIRSHNTYADKFIAAMKRVLRKSP